MSDTRELGVGGEQGQGCLDPDRVLALLAGRVDGQERDACEQHLDGCPDCRALMAELVRGAGPGTRGPRPDTTADTADTADTAGTGTPPTVELTEGGAPRPVHAGPGLAPGLRIGRYLVLELIGRGGMGIVYSAYDPELDRKVAIKVLHPGGSPAGRPDPRLRLLREAQAMAQVSHPNVISVHDVGSIDGQVFLAMELVVGTTLGQWMRRTPHDWRKALALLVRAGEGLAAAHAAGLVHRDFKPDNVLVGDDGRVRVTDFGLARPAAGAEPSRARDDGVGATAEESSLLGLALTGPGAVVGTPRYMAPEQHRGQPTDARTDQFSFCVALYEALFQQPPFPGVRLEELAGAVSSGAMRPIPRQSPVPLWVRRIVLRGLSARPEERFGSMNELLVALTHDPRRRLRRILAVAASATLLAALVGGGLHLQRAQLRICAGAEARLAGVWGPGRRAAVERAFQGTGRIYAADAFQKVAQLLDQYSATWVRTYTEACEATHRRRVQSAEALELRTECLDRQLLGLDQAVRVFTEADAATVERAAQTASLLGEAEDCSDLAALRQPVRPPARAEVRREIAELRTRLSRARVLRDLGRYQDGLAIVDPLVERALAIGYRPLEAETHFLKGDLEHYLDHEAPAEKSLQRAVWAAEASRHDEVKAQAWVRLVWVVGQNARRLDDVVPLVAHAGAAIARLGRPTELEARLANAHGSVLLVNGKPREAIPLLERGLALRSRLHTRPHPDVASSLHNLAVALLRADRAAEALPFYLRALAIREALYGNRHPDLAWSLTGVGGNLGKLGRHAEALEYHRRALAIAEQFGPAHTTVAAIQAKMAESLLRKGDPAGALPLAQRAVASLEGNHGREHTVVAGPLTLLGEVLLALDRAGEALAPLERAQAIRQKNLVSAEERAETARALERAQRASGG
jgi:tetratricopeptide (TPR) repeat protein